MKAEIKNMIDVWAKDTETRVLKNLNNRKVVGQLSLVKNIRFELQQSGDLYSLNVTFEREKQKLFYNKKSEKLEIHDPTFNKKKAWERGEREISFVRKANVYELIKGKYFNELISEITKIDAEFATKIVVGSIKG